MGIGLSYIDEIIDNYNTTLNCVELEDSEEEEKVLVADEMQGKLDRIWEDLSEFSCESFFNRIYCNQKKPGSLLQRGARKKMNSHLWIGLKMVADLIDDLKVDMILGSDGLVLGTTTWTRPIVGLLVAWQRWSIEEDFYGKFFFLEI